MSEFILTAENYFSPEMSKHYMSVSQYKDFLKCEAMAMAKINGEYQQEYTAALLVGSYVDSNFEGTLDIFKAQHPEIFMKSGELKADYRKAEEIINRIEQDKLFMEYMAGEKQTIITAEIDEVPFKIKIDSLLPDKIVDLKCMRSIEPVMGKSFIEHWNYDVQLAVYQKVYELATGKKLPTYIAVATKEPVTNLEIIHIPQWRLDECLDYVKKDLPHIAKIKSGEIPAERCGVCDYCKQTKVLTGPIDFDDA